MLLATVCGDALAHHVVLVTPIRGVLNHALRVDLAQKLLQLGRQHLVQLHAFLAVVEFAFGHRVLAVIFLQISVKKFFAKWV